MRLTSPDTLHALMHQRGLSLGELARHAGCSKGFVSHLLSGRRSSCTSVLARRLAAALDVPLDLLFQPYDTVPMQERTMTRSISRLTLVLALLCALSLVAPAGASVRSAPPQGPAASQVQRWPDEGHGSGRHHKRKWHWHKACKAIKKKLHRTGHHRKARHYSCQHAVRRHIHRKDLHGHRAQRLARGGIDLERIDFVYQFCPQHVNDCKINTWGPGGYVIRMDGVAYRDGRSGRIWVYDGPRGTPNGHLDCDIGDTTMIDVSQDDAGDWCWTTDDSDLSGPPPYRSLALRFNMRYRVKVSVGFFGASRVFDFQGFLAYNGKQWQNTPDGMW